MLHDRKIKPSVQGESPPETGRHLKSTVFLLCSRLTMSLIAANKNKEPTVRLSRCVQALDLS